MPVGPWRCLPMMTSATPVTRFICSCHSKCSCGVGPGLLAGEIIFLAVDEQHHVGVLLDRARLAQVGELRALVVAVLDLARELREGDDRHLELLGERLEADGDFGDFLHAAFGRALRAEPPRSWR